MYQAVLMHTEQGNMEVIITHTHTQHLPLATQSESYDSPFQCKEVIWQPQGAGGKVG